MVPGTGLLPDGRRFELLVAGLLATVLVGGTAFAGSLLVATMTATGTLGSGTALWLLVALLVTVLASGLGAAGAAVWLAWLALARLRTAVASGYRNLLWAGYRRARTFEDRNPLGALLRPASLFASRSDREGPLVTELKARYVAGELDELQFERELGRLLGGGADAGRRVREEIEVTAADGGADDSGDGRSGTGDRSGRSRGNEADAAAEREREASTR